MDKSKKNPTKYVENWVTDVKHGFVQEFRGFWAAIDCLPKCMANLDPNSYITSNCVFAADLLHPAFKTYEVLVLE